MGTPAKQYAILFADIVGSTRLYEMLGDAAAEALISGTLGHLAEIVANNHGTVIKTIGDEIMCRFDSSAQAIAAAREMHNYLAGKTAPSRDYKISIRIGAHEGAVIESGDDLFGDAVNVAARVVALARSGKTLITGQSYQRLPGSDRKRCQLFTQTRVKGKEAPLDVYDVVWEQTDELTRLVEHTVKPQSVSLLSVRFRDNLIRLSAATRPSLSIGRSVDCDLVIPSSQASRQHCRIECNRSKFVFTDNSANGSYIKHNEAELFFHQESIPLLGEGTISLGEPSAENDEFLVHYEIENRDA